jgi:hypothetical protein
MSEPFPNEAEYLRMKSEQDDEYISTLRLYIEILEAKLQTKGLASYEHHPSKIIPSYNLLPDPVFVK